MELPLLFLAFFIYTVVARLFVDLIAIKSEHDMGVIILGCAAIAVCLVAATKIMMGLL